MKKYLLAAILGMAIILFFIFNQVDQEDPQLPKKQTKPNVVSQTEPEFSEPKLEQKSWQQKKQEKMAIHEQNWLAYIADREVKPIKSDPSFLEAYRDYVYFGGCLTIIEALLFDTDPFRYTLPRNMRFENLPVVQQQALEKRLDKCIDLSDFSKSEYNGDSARAELMKRYQAIPPKTQNEHDLAATLILIQELQTNTKQLSRAVEGENIDQMLYLELMDIKSGIQQQMPKPMSRMREYSDSEQLLVDQLKEQLLEVDQRILENKHFDPDQIALLQSQQQSIITELQGIIVETQSSDAYLAVFDFISDHIDESHIQPLKSQFTGGIQLLPDYYETFLLPVLAHFRACEMSHPCDQDSYLAENLCFNFKKENAPLACENGVVDYYLNYHLSPNQLLDVEHIITEGY